MNAKTFKLFIALTISLWAAPCFLCEGGQLQAMAPKGEGKSAGLSSKSDKQLGLYISADAFGYIYPMFVKDKYYSAEASATFNINNRFLPVAEVGIGYTNIISELYEIGYQTRAPYYRIGMDYNMQYKNGKPNYIYLGGRIGYTSFRYNVDAPSLQDPIWGDEAPVQFKEMPCSAIWAEAVGGVRAEIFKNFYMGWSIRYKYPIHKAPISNGGPWYIPGFGAGSAGVIGATYTISYYFKL